MYTEIIVRVARGIGLVLLSLMLMWRQGGESVETNYAILRRRMERLS